MGGGQFALKMNDDDDDENYWRIGLNLFYWYKLIDRVNVNDLIAGEFMTRAMGCSSKINLNEVQLVFSRQYIESRL